MIGDLETERLVAERLNADHHDALVALLGDPRVGATLGGLQHTRVTGFDDVEVGFAYERDVEHAGLPHVLYRRLS